MLEAMRRGVPVIVTPEVGAAEIVQKASAGFVVGGDPDLLSHAINSLIHDAAVARSMGLHGQRYAIEHHAWSDTASQMEVLYKDLIVWMCLCANKLRQ